MRKSKNLIKASEQLKLNPNKLNKLHAYNIKPKLITEIIEIHPEITR